MNYTRIRYNTTSETERELLIAHMSTIDAFTGFEETDDGQLIAYATEAALSETVLQEIAALANVGYEVSEEKEQNWNATWESNFEPVLLPGFCSVRAFFHDPVPGIPYEILITPKMSFGTGHHATTKLMMLHMKEMPLANKTVLDYGTGTGILAILAEMLGSTSIDAIDIDEWSYENAKENCAHNNCSHIEVQLGDISLIAGKQYDVILANINRHILLDSMATLSTALNEDGTLILSGILKEQDTDIILESAAQAGLKPLQFMDDRGWAAISFTK
ncbi:50S ribosomal protein L11 methyltransferase [Taibaiella sp. KBW10]|uniref:50S ribosomal protein L11 methyltransferase n=1 Tax=Taibaiella sp. KBW10 TaxID=2153357 RepID=UPI000F5A73D6|nr:50S ribosomal protein L11 methyltransferase [Taibaiella sp. KBW10]RQO29992.1 50S ribosomal protein L11 methyltransferase [Taibaiella sp. KBW10]